MRIPPALLTTLKIIASILVIGAFLWALASQAGEIGKYTFQVSPIWLILAALFAILRGPLIVYPWWRIVTAWGYGFPWWRAVRVYFHSGLARYIPGQYWFVLSRALLAEREGVPKRVTTAATLFETLLVTGAAGGVALVGFQFIADWTDPVRYLILGGSIIAPMLLMALVSYEPITRIWARLARLIKFDLPRPRLANDDSYWAISTAYLNWACYGLVAAFSLAGVSANSAAYIAQYPAIIGCFCASVLGAAVVLFVPQGIVVREGVFVFLLNTLLAVPIPEAVVAAALTRLIATAAEGLWAAATLRVKQNQQ